MPIDLQNLKIEICDIGRRLYARGFAAGNDGNLSVRLAEDRFLCTPTLICKGFMQPEELCIVNGKGELIEGARPATSEILLHLEIYRSVPEANAVVHCHPPHATAFGVAGRDVPTGVLPEAEIFLGEVPRAPYETPGTQKFAETVRPFLPQANTIILANHGTVSWGPTIERAYWLTETLDACCRVYLLAEQLGGINRLSEENRAELADLRTRFAGPGPA